MAVCGEPNDATASFAAACGAAAFSSLEEMFAAETGIDLVVVCSPVGFHAEHIIKSLQAGKDVVCESPLCLTKAAAWQIIETEKYCGRKLYLVQTSRFFDPFLQFRKDIAERAGTVRSFNAFCSVHLPETFFEGPDGRLFPGGGLLYKPFGVLIDMLVSLFGEVAGATGLLINPGRRHDEEIETTGAATIVMQDGIVGNLQWSGANFLLESSLRLTVLSDKGADELLVDEPHLFLQAGKATNAASFETKTAGIYETAYRHLARALNGGQQDFPGLLDGARTVEAIEKIYKAIR